MVLAWLGYKIIQGGKSMASRKAQLCASVCEIVFTEDNELLDR